jgi:DMSO reductase anchor subunit
MLSNDSYHINYIENNQYLNLSTLKAIVCIIVVNHEIMNPKIMNSLISIPKTVTSNEFLITNFTIIEVFQKVGTCLDRTTNIITT